MFNGIDRLAALAWIVVGQAWKACKPGMTAAAKHCLQKFANMKTLAWAKVRINFSPPFRSFFISTTCSFLYSLQHSGTILALDNMHQAFLSRFRFQRRPNSRVSAASEYENSLTLRMEAPQICFWELQYGLTSESKWTYIWLLHLLKSKPISRERTQGTHKK